MQEAACPARALKLEAVSHQVDIRFDGKTMANNARRMYVSVRSRAARAAASQENVAHGVLSPPLDTDLIASCVRFRTYLGGMKGGCWRLHHHEALAESPIVMAERVGTMCHEVCCDY